MIDAKTDEADTDGYAWVKLGGFSPEAGGPRLARYIEERGFDQKFLHPAIEQGYAKMAAETNREKRYAIARQVIATLAENVIVIPLFSVDMAFVVGPRVGDWDPTPGLNAFTNLETVTLAG